MKFKSRRTELVLYGNRRLSRLKNRSIVVYWSSLETSDSTSEMFDTKHTEFLLVVGPQSLCHSAVLGPSNQKKPKKSPKNLVSAGLYHSIFGDFPSKCRLNDLWPLQLPFSNLRPLRHWTPWWWSSSDAPSSPHPTAKMKDIFLYHLSRFSFKKYISDYD